MEIILIILAIFTALSVIFTCAFALAIYSEYPEMKVGDIIDAFSSDKPKVEEKHKRIDIVV